MTHPFLLSPIRLRSEASRPTPATSPTPEPEAETWSASAPSASSTDVTMRPAEAAPQNQARLGSPFELRIPDPMVGARRAAGPRPSRQPRPMAPNFSPAERYTLGMAGFSNGQLYRMTQRLLQERIPERAPWLVAHHGALLGQGFTTDHIVSLVTTASRQARNALRDHAWELLGQGWTHQQLVGLATTPGCAPLLVALPAHGQILLGRGYTHDDLMRFATASHAADRLRDFANMYWPEGPQVPLASRKRIRDHFLTVPYERVLAGGGNGS